MNLLRNRLVVAALVATLGSAAACSDDSPLATADDPVVFGEGVRPPAIPSDFPIPSNAVIGSTMIDRTNHRTEMALQVGSGLEAVVQYFNVGLVSQGYVVGASHGTAAAWTISFSRGELSGEIDFSAAGAATQVLVAVNGI
ncbi:MAG TPA: hypothetical protein DCY40_01610 [Actinobacteria bacterium]|nr:hypothetical protein [Actinomycetota bacterium]